MALTSSPIHIRSDAVSGAGRAVQDIALGALIGGNLFGRVAMHPALGDISDRTERGRVLNRAWRRYGTINSLALVALTAGWVPARLNETRPRWLSRRERRLAMAKDIALGATVITGLASAAGGIGFAQQAPDGAVPMCDGSEPAPEAPRGAARLKHVVNALGALNLLAELSLAASNAALSQVGFRRPPLRRLLRRRY
jgi:hypothetical protein